MKARSNVLGRLPGHVITGTTEVLMIAAILENVVLDLRRKSRRLHHDPKEKTVLTRLCKSLTFVSAKKPRIIGFLKH